MKLLKEFWYGNIEPTEYDSDASNRVVKTIRERVGGDCCC